MEIPRVGTTGSHIVVHVCRTEEEDGVVVRELSLEDVGAIVLDMSAIVNVVIRIYKTNVGNPVPSLLSPLGISSVPGVAG